MCGINGFYNYSEVTISEERETLVKKMNHAIRHRGPDDRGFWTSEDQKVAFGHQRLSILDLSSNGHQPMRSTKGSVIVYNGEVYNFKLLKEQLGKQTFSSNTDTEVILNLYEREGQSFLDKLNGMFALVIWNKDKQELFLARDRIGIKPLYYSTQNGIFAFSSEIKPILQLPWIQAALDEEAFYDFLTYNKLSPPQTMFKDIYKFHPGHKMIVGSGGIKEYGPFWEVTYSNFDKYSQNELEEKILCELRKSVELRMVSDVPVGAFLSGGVDSSALVALMTRNNSANIKTFSIGFEDAPDFDELKYARKIANQFKTDHYEQIISPKDIQDFLPKIVDIYDEPVVDSTSIPIYFICQLAREQKTPVILTGDGPDELFAGYRNWMRYIKLYPQYRSFSRMPHVIKSMIVNGYKLFDRSSPTFEMLCRAKHNQEFFWGGARGFKESTKSLFLSPEFQARMKDADSYQKTVYYRELFENISKNSRKETDIDWLVFCGLKDGIPNFFLHRADRLGMAHSLELRVPYLDHNFVNLALSIGGQWKIKNGEPKYIFKKSLETILSHETLYRKKQGFCVPMQDWIVGPMLEFIQDELSNFCQQTGLFNKVTLQRQINEIKKGNKNYTNTLWTVYFLMTWFKKWLL